MTVDEWFQVQDIWHKAIEVYNDRLKLARAERERGNWSMKLDVEYDAMHDAQTRAYAANKELYRSLALTKGNRDE
jgi:hypothetical protein